MGAVVTIVCMGGGICVELGDVLHRSGSDSDPLWIGVVGRVPADWDGAGRISPLSDTEIDGAESTSEQGQDLDLTYPGVSNGRGRDSGDQNIHRLLPEH